MRNILSEEQLEIAAWYFAEGRTQREIANWLGIPRRTLSDRLAKIRWAFVAAGVNLPEPSTDAEQTRHTRNVSPELLASI